MKNLYFKILFLSFMLNPLFLLFLEAQESSVSVKSIENFQSETVNTFPKNFVTYPFQKKKVLKVYRVQQENDNLFLHAEDVPGMTMQVLRKFKWSPPEARILSWKWRALKLPAGAAENTPALNDSACSVYVVFGGYGGRAIKYLWSSTLPLGTVMNKDNGQMIMVVAETGNSYLGQWRTASIDVIQEYKKYFSSTSSKELKEVKAFGLLTDGDQTRSASACDYDDFIIIN